MARRLRPTKALLLTGAGFAKPFGGYLTSEFWALIFRQPEVRKFHRLRTRMLAELNFEVVYDEVMTQTTTYSSDERFGLIEAVWRSYRQMQTEIRSSFTPTPVDWTI